MRRLSILFVFALITSLAYTARAADKTVAHTTYKAELSGQAEVPSAGAPPVETNATGEATFQLSGPGISGGGPGGAGETGAAGPAGGEAKEVVVDSGYYSGILDQSQSTGLERAGAGAGVGPGGVAPGPLYRGVEPGPPDSTVDFYYKGIIDRPVSAKGGPAVGGAEKKSTPDSNYYSGIVNTGVTTGGAAGGSANDVLHYQLNVKNIENVTAAHLHMGKKGTPTAEAPVIAPLYLGPQKAGTFSGLLAEGTITAKDLKGPMSGKTIRDLARLMERGEVFVNVHTARHPVGEIRGEVTPG